MDLDLICVLSCTACMDHSARHLAFHTSRHCRGARRSLCWDTAASARVHHINKYTNTLKHKHTFAQSCRDTWSRLTEFGRGKRKKRQSSLFACWQAGYCISGLRDRALNISWLTGESGHDQQTSSSHRFKSGFLWSSSESAEASPPGPRRTPLQRRPPLFSRRSSERLSFQIIHQAKTRQSAGTWELREW